MLNLPLIDKVLIARSSRQLPALQTDANGNVIRDYKKELELYVQIENQTQLDSRLFDSHKKFSDHIKDNTITPIPDKVHTPLNTIPIILVESPIKRSYDRVNITVDLIPTKIKEPFKGRYDMFKVELASSTFSQKKPFFYTLLKRFNLL